jgi:SAM-dependent methyltransferase
LGTDSIFKGEISDFDFKSEFFDAVTFTDVLEHIYNPNLYFKKIYELLGQGGVFAVRTPNEGALTRRILGKKWHLFSPRHIALYNKKSLKKILEDYSFDILKIKAEKEPLRSLLPPFYVWRNYRSFSFRLRARYFFINWIQNILRFTAGALGMGDSLFALAQKK